MSNVDEFSHHEVLHMSSKLLEACHDWLVDHPAIQSDPERLRLANEAADKIMELYQLIGSQAKKYS